MPTIISSEGTKNGFHIIEDGEEALIQMGATIKVKPNL